MKRNKDLIISLSIIGLIIVLCLGMYLAIWINSYILIKGSQPKITKDINASESTLLLDEFGISLPPDAEITAFNFTEDEINIRIEGVEDMPTFLMDSISLGIDVEKAESLSEYLYQSLKQDTNLYTDMYGIDHQYWCIHTTNYSACPLDYSIRISGFFLDEKLVIEMRKSNISLQNRDALRDMVRK